METLNILKQTRISWLATAVCVVLSALSHGATARGADGVTAVPVVDFLNSLGANSAIAGRGERLQKTIECARYLGLRWFRASIEGNVPIEKYIKLHQQAGVRFSWSPGSGGSDLAKLVETGRELAGAGALLAFEGPNEPNNWGVTYQGKAGGRNGTWVPVASFQRDLYQAVKSDPILKQYPVWSISECGAETDNVGLQFLSIPEGADTVMPVGTKYADFANVHNYIYHPNSPGVEDNKTWNAADPTSACKVDGLYGEYGRAWAHHFKGYSGPALETLPRVTTETGCLIGGEITEHIHALNLLTLYLDQFKRGWSCTAVYLLRDRVDEAGNQKFGFYRPDYAPREAAVYLHNLTTILADHESAPTAGKLDYSIPDEPTTAHDLLLQKSNGTFALIVWSEKVKGATRLKVKLGSPPGEVDIYDPTEGTAAIQTLQKTDSVELTLTDHPLVLAIGP